jgi:hypothetical protein
MQSRVTISIPLALVRAADRRAKGLGRSRSWVLTDALRRYLQAPAAVSEPAATYRAGIGPYRQAQLEADLSLSPEQRVKEAARAAVAPPGIPHHRRDRLLTFDTYESYLDWQRKDDLR